MQTLLGIFDKLCGYVTVVDDAMASVAEELEVAEVSDTFTAVLYLIVENLMHVQRMAEGLAGLSPIADFTKSNIAHRTKRLPDPRKFIA